mmetsp:Transcript_104656/g.302863  ORF Transcript_104656/g.302863 Transcript_104656/m.302863 type:complete len:261 (-) Transcript_104656:482-1264(-)
MESIIACLIISSSDWRTAAAALWNTLRSNPPLRGDMGSKQCSSFTPKVCLKKITAEPNKNSGRGELWSPSKMTKFLSPMYALCNCSEWLGFMKLSFSPCANNAGMKLLSQFANGLTSLGSKLARRLTERRIIPTATDMAKPGNGICSRKFWPSSLINCIKSAKPLSKTMPAIEGSRSPYSKAVTAPMEWPQRPTVETSPLFLKCSMTAATSSRSKKPRDTYSPPETPEPEKSNANTETEDGNKCSNNSCAANRHPALPCK